jgi:hypothetical protein
MKRPWKLLIVPSIFSARRVGYFAANEKKVPAVPVLEFSKCHP